MQRLAVGRPERRLIKREVEGRDPLPPYRMRDPSSPAIKFIWVVFVGFGLIGAYIWGMSAVPRVPLAGPAILGCAVFALVYSAALRKRLTPLLSWRRALTS